MNVPSSHTLTDSETSSFTAAVISEVRQNNFELNEDNFDFKTHNSANVAQYSL